MNAYVSRKVFCSKQMAFPLLPLDPQRMKRKREEEEFEDEDNDRYGEYQWVFVGNAATGKRESIPYAAVVQDADAFNNNEVEWVAEERAIFKFKYNSEGETPFVVNPSRMADPQQMMKMQTYNGYIIHSRWIDRKEYEMYAFVEKEFNALNPLEQGYTVPDVTCGRKFRFMYGLTWAKASM